MSTRETQKRIVDTSIALFNEYSSKAISTNRIAEDCNLSRGNLHYHFRTKEEIIQTIFQRMDEEMNQGWYEDHASPTMQHLQFMFERQIRLIWKYRFFFRELNTLLQNDARLKVLFLDNRQRRIQEVDLFFRELIRVGLLREPEAPVSLDALLKIAWLVTDQWLSHLDLEDRDVNEESIAEGHALVMHLFEPYFSDSPGRADLGRSP